MYQQQILDKIEELRMHLYMLAAKNKGFNSELVTASQRLDAVLNAYYGMLKTKAYRTI